MILSFVIHPLPPPPPPHSPAPIRSLPFLQSRLQEWTWELGGIVLALQSAALSEDVSYCAITRQFCVSLRNGWDREGACGKATLATAPDADILQEIVCLLTQRVRAGRATFLMKVKAHREVGEPLDFGLLGPNHGYTRPALVPRHGLGAGNRQR
jgi:hypothetical protein